MCKKINIKSLFILLTLINTNTFLYGMENEAQSIDLFVKQLENRYGKVLKEQAEKTQPKNKLRVPLWNSDFITSTPYTREKMSISTFHLNHMAVALYAMYNNEDQYAGIIHYPEKPFANLADSVKAQCNHLCTTQNENKQLTEVRSFIILPGKYDHHEKLIFDTVYQYHYDALAYVIKKIFSKIKFVDVKHSAYDPSLDPTEKSKKFKITLYPDKVRMNYNNEYIELTKFGTTAGVRKKW